MQSSKNNLLLKTSEDRPNQKMKDYKDKYHTTKIK